MVFFCSIRLEKIGKEKEDIVKKEPPHSGGGSNKQVEQEDEGSWGDLGGVFGSVASGQAYRSKYQKDHHKFYP